MTQSSLAPYFNNVRGDIRPGSFRLQKLLTKYLNEGILNFPCILVTGSNGKGSTCAYLESFLRAHGFKTGLYTSPHLVHPNERIRILGVPVVEELIQLALEEIQVQVNLFLPDASFFEIATGTALLIFLKQKIDFLICEIGLGGRYDSTNALSPLVSVLTAVSLEHTSFLGDSLYKIAFDKSHISRRNRPLIVGLLHEDAIAGVKETVDKIGSTIVHGVTNNNTENPNLELSISAFHALAEQWSSLEINLEKLDLGIRTMRWPGRFDVRMIKSREVIFDAAHNPDGFQYFLNQYSNSKYKHKKFVLLFACLNDKDWKSIFKQIPKFAEYVIFTQLDSLRSELVDNYVKEIPKLEFPFVEFETYSKYGEAFDAALKVKPHLPIVCTGSIAFIGSLMNDLNVVVFE